MKDRSHRATFLAAALAISLSTFSARASDEAQKAFDDAIKAADRGDVATSCKLFEKSYALDPASGTLLNIAGCKEGLGDFVAAYNAFARVNAEAVRAKRKDRVDLSRGRMDLLTSKVARVVLRVAEPLPPSHSVWLDDREAPELTERMLAVAPGPHTIEVRGPHGVAWQGSLVAQVGAIAETPPIPGLEREPAAEAPPPSAPRDALPSPASSPKNPQRVAGLVLGGVGVVALGTCAVTGLMAFGKKSDADAIARTDPVRANTLTQDGESLANVADVSGVIGAVALAGGVVLFVTAPKSSATKTSARGPTITPFVGPLSGLAGSF